jgi:hypothetical protein
MYKLLKIGFSKEPNCVTIQKGKYLLTIPFNEANTDYQEYLKWLEEGNTPLPADDNGGGE